MKEHEHSGFRPQVSDTVAFNRVFFQVKYPCEPKNDKDFIGHEYTDTNPIRLFNKIASFYNAGDKVTTIPISVIRDALGVQVEITEPLNSNELRMLGIEILIVLGKK